MLNINKYFIIILLSTYILFALPIDHNNSEITNIQALQTAFKKSPSKLLKNIPQKKFLKRFYRSNNYNPLWLQADKLNKTKYNQLFEQIKDDITLDHKSIVYKNYQTLSKQLENNISQIEPLRIEVKLSSLYYNFLLHAVYGEICWKKFSYKLASLKKRRINATWIKRKPKFNFQNLLKENNIEATLQKVRPKNFSYPKLLLALKNLELLKKEGAWEDLPSFKKLALGSSGDIVLKLRTRLKVSSDYMECNEINTSTSFNILKKESRDINLSKEAIFGHCLDKAVKTFQQRHGLVVDGIVGGGTRKALNISIDEKITKIRLNLDRIKWLPREEKERFLIVNIPEFMLHYIERGTEKKTLPVIVGDTRHPTPIFSEKISFIVLNPYWKIPEGIVKREIIPAVVKNPNYLRQQGLEAHRTWNENSRLIDTSMLYWENYLHYGEKFPYRLMQPPGPKNALGKIKFKFPNRFSVYLHDTPTKYLFKRNVRAFSHGCMRLYNPRELLETIATFNPNINIRKAKKILKGKKKTQLNMNEKLPIYIVYLTVGVNKNEKIEFRNDIYKYDKYQKRQLR